MIGRLPGSRFSLPVKLAFLAFLVQVATGVVLFVALDATFSWPRAIGVAALLSIPIWIIVFLGRFIILRLTAPVIDAYRRLAGGDFDADFPEATLGSDFLVVRGAFTSMAGALRDSMEKLRQADLERRALFADLAHELATPTSTLLGIAEALREKRGEVPRLLEHLGQETARLERLIADVREVAHLEDPTMSLLVEPVDVGGLAARAVERMRIAAPGACEIRCDAPPTPATVDPVRIDQVFTNLLGNAIRYAPGGTVAVVVRVESSHVLASVEDSGAGVPDELLAQLGRRLLRVDPSRSRDTGGHGLGLSIVRAIVARHGGEVTFGRASLGGLSVELRLPLDGPGPEPS